MRIGQFLRALLADLLQGPRGSTGGLRGWNAWLDDFITRFQLFFLVLLFRSPRAIAAEGGEKGNTAIPAKGMERPNTATRLYPYLLSCPPTLFLTRTLYGDVIYSTSDIHIHSCTQPWGIRQSDNGVRS